MEIDIGVKLNSLRVVQKNGNKILLELLNQQFYIIIPENKEDSHFVDIPITLNGFSWLNKINEYIFDKNPNLQDIVTFIENKHLDMNKNKNASNTIKRDIFNVPDLEIDKYDLEERKYRRTLENILSTKKSKLNLSENDSTQALFSGKIPGVLIMNEFFELRKKYSKNSNIEILLDDDNVYVWKLKFKNFTNKKLTEELELLNKKYGIDYVELEIDFHDKLYPNYPPFIKVIRPRLNNGLMHRITNMKMTQLEYWSPCRSMNFITNKLYNTLNDHCSIDIESEMNDITKYKIGAYHSLESILVKLASLCDVKDESEPLDKEVYNKVTNVTNSNKEVTKTKTKKNVETVWKKGTGYGHSGAGDWDPNEYIKMQEEKDKQIRSVLSIVMGELNNYKQEEELLEVYNIIKNSYLIPFIKSYLHGANILDMSKRFEMYQFLLLFMQILTTENSIFLFDNHNANESKSLYELLEILNKEAIQIGKLSNSKNTDVKDSDTDISLMVISLYDMVTPIFKTYIENKKKFQSEDKSNEWNKKMENANKNIETINQKYQQIMSNLRFDTAKFTNGFTYSNELKNSSPPSKIMTKILASEYATMINGLPIFFESSVFVRVSEQDNRCVKILITGPKDTPYDSGCFIFDLYTGQNYPENTPKMLFLNTGGVRFNPNLYNCGKVCLSLLGTWQGSASEKWNPKTSTLQQLFISIQSQILIEQPFYNEPGHETSYATPAGQETSRQYNCERWFYTMIYAMYDLINKPDSYPEFQDIIKNHFTLKKEYILQLCDKWRLEPNNKFEKQTIEIIDKLRSVLEKL